MPKLLLILFVFLMLSACGVMAQRVTESLIDKLKKIPITASRLLGYNLPVFTSSLKQLKHRVSAALRYRIPCNHNGSNITTSVQHLQQQKEKMDCCIFKRTTLASDKTSDKFLKNSYGKAVNYQQYFISLQYAVIQAKVPALENGYIIRHIVQNLRNANPVYCEGLGRMLK